MADLHPQRHGSGTTSDTATSRSAAAKQHPLSCIHCRQRKIKCDKVHPCSPCSRSGFTCAFPERVRHPKRKTSNSKAANDELLQRLARMEELIAKMKQDEGKGNHDNEFEYGRDLTSTSRPEMRRESTQTSDLLRPKRENSGDIGGNDSTLAMGGAFIKRLTNEVAGLKEAMDDISDEEEHSPEPSQTPSEPRDAHTSILFGSKPIPPQKLRLLHPSPQHMITLGNLYARNCDPMFKALHIPSLEKLILHASNNVQEIPYGNYVEALLFAVYFCAVVSLRQEECLEYFQDRKEDLLSRYRSGTETALANADMLNTKELGTLQALVIFLACVRAIDDSQFFWIMTGVAIRLAHSFGLHREGSRPNLSPFQTELRRRLWWQIIHLDIRCSEDRASDPFILPNSFSTKLPLNINDSDMDPQSMSPIPERIGFTEMTKTRGAQLCWEAVMRIAWDAFEPKTLSDDGQENPQPTVSFEEKSGLIDQLEKTLEDQIVIHCNPEEPLQWITLAVSRLVVARLRLSTYYPPAHSGRPIPHHLVSRETVLKTATQNLEWCHLLDTESAVAHWRWWMNTHVQWHALAATLAELCVQDKGPWVERAWTIVDVVFDDWTARIADSDKNTLWRAIKKLMSKAQAKRNESKTQMANAMPQQQLPLPPFRPFSPLQDPSLANVPYHPNSVLGYARTLNLEQSLASDIFSSLDINNTGDSINWTEWDEFMQDFEMVDASTVGLGAVQQNDSETWW